MKVSLTNPKSATVTKPCLGICGKKEFDWRVLNPFGEVELNSPVEFFFATTLKGGFRKGEGSLLFQKIRF
jgi:hypothetical protein